MCCRGLSTYAVRPSSTKHGLDEVWSSEEPPWTCLAPKFQWQHASTRCNFMLAGDRHMQPAWALCCMPSRASASTSCLIPIRVGRGITRTISENLENYAFVDSNLPHCEGRLGKSTTWAAVLDFEDATWHCSKITAKVDRVSLVSTHRYISCKFQSTESTNIRSILILLPQMGVAQPFFKSVESYLSCCFSCYL